jgi:hypothetical protein
MEKEKVLEQFWFLVYEWQEANKADGETQAKATDKLERFVLEMASSFETGEKIDAVFKDGNLYIR